MQSQCNLFDEYLHHTTANIDACTSGRSKSLCVCLCGCSQMGETSHLKCLSKLRYSGWLQLNFIVNTCLCRNPHSGDGSQTEMPSSKTSVKYGILFNSSSFFSKGTAFFMHDFRSLHSEECCYQATGITMTQVLVLSLSISLPLSLPFPLSHFVSLSLHVRGFCILSSMMLNATCSEFSMNLLHL